MKPNQVNTPGTFKSRHITMAGQPYQLIGCEKRGTKYFHTVKNAAGDYKDFEHGNLVGLVDKGCVV